MNRNIYSIILAGGSGRRMGQPLPKQFLPLGNQPLIMVTISRFAMVKEVKAILVVVPEEYREQMEEILQKHPEKKILKLVTGGATRQESAWNALVSENFQGDDILLIHDAARPFITPEKITACITGADRHGAAGLYLPATDTITEIHEKKVISIPDRSSLYYTQTPQSFRFDVIQRAHESAQANPDKTYTDDVSMVLAAGDFVAAVEGDTKNIKVTTPFDYDLACWMIEREKDG